MRLITCSNSGPQLVVRGDRPQVSPAAPGGLVPILSALLEEIGGYWVYAGPGEPDKETVSEAQEPRRSITWRSLAIDEGLMARQHEFVNVRSLIWTFHYLHDTAVEPTFTERFKDDWQAHEEVNRRFARALAQAHSGSGDELVLVHDVHLMLVPGYFAASAPRRRSALAYFHHIPWCDPDYFGMLPRPAIDGILQSLLTCDFVGFHAERWGDAFLACCERYVVGAEVSGRSVTYRGHSTTVTTAPGPVDAVALDEVAERDATGRLRGDLLRWAAGRRIIARVERVDLWKNLVRGLLAFERLLERRPDLVDDVWLCAMVAPTRLQTERHDAYRVLCHGVAQRINERYGRRGDAVSLLYPVGGNAGRERSVAALSVAHVTLINPTFDGMNLVAKEALICNPASRVLLSTNAGAYAQLQSEVMPVEPFDVVATAEVLEDAITTAGGPGARPDGLAAALRRETAYGWVRRIVGDVCV